MQALYSKKFIKSYEKKSQKIKLAFVQRKDWFLDGKQAGLLKDHELQGKWSGHRNINITGDYRAIYRVVSDRPKTIQFVVFDTHSELYE